MPIPYRALMELFPGPGRRERANDGTQGGKIPPEWPARTLGLGVIALAALLGVLGLVLVWRGLGVMVLIFQDWEALALSSFWLGISATSLGAWLFYEAFWPWIMHVPVETPWCRSLGRQAKEDPLQFLFAWCREAKCPEPLEVEITWETNAALDLQGALRGEIRLRIGLPLFLGMNRDQLHSVVLHELGHFTHRKKLWAVLRHQELGRRISLGALLPGHPFWTLMSRLWPRIEGLAQPWLHGLETDADAFARSQPAGRHLTAAMLRLKVLEQGTSQTMRTVQSAMASGVLPDDLCSLFLQEKNALMQPLAVSLERRALEQPATMTHPALKERLAGGETEKPDSDPLDIPAWLPSEEQSRAFSEAYFEHELGEEKKTLGRVSVGDARCRLSRSQDAFSALDHYFLGLVKDIAPIRPLPQILDHEREWLGAMNAIARLPLTRKTLNQGREAWLDQRRKWEEAHADCRSMAAGESQSAIAGIADKLRPGTRGGMLESLVQRESAASELRNATDQLSQRLTYGLLLLEHPEVTSAWPEARLWRKVAIAWRDELPLLSRLLGYLEEVSFDLARLDGLDNMPVAKRKICEAESRRQIWLALSKVIGALQHKTPSDPAFHENASELFERQGSMPTQAIVEKMENLYARMGQAYLQGLGDLAYAAGKAELIAGIKPWE